MKICKKGTFIDANGNVLDTDEGDVIFYDFEMNLIKQNVIDLANMSDSHTEKVIWDLAKLLGIDLEKEL